MTEIVDEPIARPVAFTDRVLEEWPNLEEEDRLELFRSLDRGPAGEVILGLRLSDRAALLGLMPGQERRVWLRVLAPDDAADVIQSFPEHQHEELVALLDPRTKTQVEALLAYRADVAGGKMNPNYSRLRPEMSVEEAIAYLRLQAIDETGQLYYAYVLDPGERLLGVLSFRNLLLARPSRTVREVMTSDLATVSPETDQEEVARLLAERRLLAVPVVDGEGRMQGIITADDVLDVVREEATEDIHKIGGVEALDLPYFQTRPLAMLRKRAGWLSILFVSEMLTATAMGFFQDEIARAVILAVFVPLIISSGGNSGSQASTLIIRAMALGEVRLRDWWKVVHRELGYGLSLGAILAVLGVVRISVWQQLFGSYGDVAFRLAATVGISLVGVVAWGTMMGSSLPFLLRRAGFDPASASAPFVATLVDVTGLIIYFSVAKVILLDSV
jgi:magnesium transporter